MTARRLLLAGEFVLLFCLLPVLFATRRLPVPMFGALWGLAAICLAALLLSREFDRRRLWNAGAVRPHLASILLPVVVATPLLLIATLIWDPERLFGFVREQPLLWLVVMVLYPVLSVYPQSLVYRAFLFHRYRELFPSPGSQVLASGLAFGLAHLIMQNWIAPLLSLIGGLLFAWTYSRTRSLLASAVQHALFGCLLFTLGLGWYFYYGPVRGS